MNYNILFNQKAKELILNRDIFIYKTNLELWRQFFNSLCTKWVRWGLDPDIAISYLDNFKCVEDITPSKIEQYYSDILLENMLDTLYLYDYEKYNGNGLYFIYNEYGDIIYIGMSSSVESRAIQSFLNKYPYGSTSIKILTWENLNKDDIKMLESVMIHSQQPLYNNTIETININHRQYYNYVSSILKYLDNTNHMVITSRKLILDDEDL